MPFTLSHPAAVIPLARGRLVPSALVVGSMAPDVPYFFAMGDLRGATHDPVGIFTVDLVLGLGLFAAFHLVWKRPMVVLAPRWARRRLAVPASGFHRAMIFWVPVSLLVGTVTHVFWDAFTHRWHGFAELLPWLVTTSFGGLETYRWLQYGSGLGGALIIVWWSWRWIRRAPVGQEPPWNLSKRGVQGAWVCLLASACGGGLIGAITLINQPDLPRTFHMTLASGVIGTICGGTIELTVFGLPFRLGALARLDVGVRRNGGVDPDGDVRPGGVARSGEGGRPGAGAPSDGTARSDGAARSMEPCVRVGPAGSAGLRAWLGCAFGRGWWSGRGCAFGWGSRAGWACGFERGRSSGRSWSLGRSCSIGGGARSDAGGGGRLGG